MKASGDFRRSAMAEVGKRPIREDETQPREFALTAKIEPFDSFWEAPEDIEKGYGSFYQFYKHNYLKYVPGDKEANILVISCGPGYFVNLLNKEGYRNVLGIDSNADKVRYAEEKGLNCTVEEAFPFLTKHVDRYDVIFCEQELNHLTKEEILMFLKLCWESLRPDGTLIVHVLNGGNPITGAEALAQNFDHYNTFTEYTLRQALNFAKFEHITVIPLNLYVFYKNPLNYILISISTIYTLFFKFSFKLYGKSNKLFTKKIGAICKKPVAIQL
jgi:2-polyprenyl-3-methyl-5-hydroxy-6-metoxy-1,4-benzoquinol methylase